ncbi:YbaB/EbfC family nucleoid-associated protein [Saccharothrix deserti]|uniref:YbaB/EbfC family nucleoid-associated protein n=1 Tax=Saccharothrix deserti TaxID=2593674 RepID=UPI00131C030B|nr:YbaB/EbfC family nucleoid-associated protein [Saccharothrix deserti]
MRAAANSAARTAYDVVAAQLPPGSTPEEADLIFAPALHALDRHTGPPTAAPRPDDVPVIGEGLDRERGELLDLRLDPRVYRDSDSRRLAARITSTVRDAGDRARARIAADLNDILAGRSP